MSLYNWADWDSAVDEQVDALHEAGAVALFPILAFVLTVVAIVHFASSGAM
jgi:ABC-type dipeptide/oligopeptide/nickel transport system permease subunit